MSTHYDRARRRVRGLFRDAWRENRFLMVLVAVTLAALAVGWGAYAVFGHRVIETAYRGEGFGPLTRAFQDRATRPLESYYARVDTLLVLLSGYFLIGVATVGSLVLRPRNRRALGVWVVLVSGAIVATMSYVEPALLGDGPEYVAMSESIADHASPDLRDGDVERLERLETRFGVPYTRRDPHPYYFESIDGKWYSYHFWLYPAATVPVKLGLRAIGANEVKACQITNAILLAIALLLVVFRARLDGLQRRLFALLVVFSPAFWFVYWPHAEVFCYSLVIVALVNMTRKRYGAAVFWAAVASTQCQPLAFFVVLLWLRGMVASGWKRRDLLRLSAAGLPALLPVAFFYLHFRVASLIGAEAASLSNLSAKKALELFFDLNIGMLPYLPVVVVAFVVLVGRDVLFARRATTSLQFAAVLFLMALACTPTYLWNHGTTGPSRYVIWMLPLVFYAVVEAIGRIPQRRRLLAGALGAGVAMQAAMVVGLGGFVPPITQTRHTYMARFVLDHMPALYNPSYQIFAVRTSHHMPTISHTSDGGFRSQLPPTPIVYRSGGRCHKALIRRGEVSSLEAQCGKSHTPVSFGTGGGPVYVDY